MPFDYKSECHQLAQRLAQATEIIDGHSDELVALINAEAEIKRLRAALTQFVAACDTAPPTSLMVEIGMACNVARAALGQPPLHPGG